MGEKQEEMGLGRSAKRPHSKTEECLVERRSTTKNRGEEFEVMDFGPIKRHAKATGYKLEESEGEPLRKKRIRSPSHRPRRADTRPRLITDKDVTTDVQTYERYQKYCDEMFEESLKRATVPPGELAKLREKKAGYLKGPTGAGQWSQKSTTDHGGEMEAEFNERCQNSWNEIRQKALLVNGPSSLKVQVNSQNTKVVKVVKKSLFEPQVTIKEEPRVVIKEEPRDPEVEMGMPQVQLTSVEPKPGPSRTPTMVIRGDTLNDVTKEIRKVITQKNHQVVPVQNLKSSLKLKELPQLELSPIQRTKVITLKNHQKVIPVQKKTNHPQTISNTPKVIKEEPRDPFDEDSESGVMNREGVLGSIEMQIKKPGVKVIKIPKSMVSESILKNPNFAGKIFIRKVGENSGSGKVDLVKATSKES